MALAITLTAIDYDETDANAAVLPIKVVL